MDNSHAKPVSGEIVSTNDVVLSPEPPDMSHLDSDFLALGLKKLVIGQKLKSRDDYLDREEALKSDIESAETALDKIRGTVADFDKRYERFCEARQRDVEEYFRLLEKAYREKRKFYDQDIQRLEAVRINRLRLIDAYSSQFRTVEKLPLAWYVNEDTTWCPKCDGLHKLGMGMRFAPCQFGQNQLNALIYVTDTYVGDHIITALNSRFVWCDANKIDDERCTSDRIELVVDEKGHERRLCQRHYSRDEYTRKVTPRVINGYAPRPSCPKAWVKLSELKRVEN